MALLTPQIYQLARAETMTASQTLTTDFVPIPLSFHHMDVLIKETSGATTAGLTYASSGWNLYYPGSSTTVKAVSGASLLGSTANSRLVGTGLDGDVFSLSGNPTDITNGLGITLLASQTVYTTVTAYSGTGSLARTPLVDRVQVVIRRDATAVTGTFDITATVWCTNEITGPSGFPTDISAAAVVA